MDRRASFGAIFALAFLFVLWPLLHANSAAAAEYRIKVLPELAQEYSLFDLQHSTHIVRFRVLRNDTTLTAVQLRPRLTQDLWAVAVEDTGRATPPDAVFLAASRLQDNGRLSFVDDTTIVARFAERHPARLYHYRVFFRPVSGGEPIASAQTVYMRGGYPWEVANLLKIALMSFCWAGLGLTFLVGLVAAVRMHRRLKTKKRLLLNNDVFLPLIESHWKWIANEEQIRRTAGSAGWDQSMINKCKDMRDSLKPYISLQYCALARILDGGISNHYMNRGADLASSEIDRAMMTEAAYEESCLRGRAHELIRQMAVLSPLFGLFGTVVGISYAFGDLLALSKLQQVDALAHLAKPLQFALTTTIVGLFVAVILSIIHTILTDSIKKITESWYKAIVMAGREI